MNEFLTTIIVAEVFKFVLVPIVAGILYLIWRDSL